MSQYLVLARKWRPQKFSDILGQEHIATTLQNALGQNRIYHSYLFAGPRGIGKTTTARILAKAINCEKETKGEPCNSCSSCLEITENRSLDVIEIDGASNNGVDQVRDLRQNTRFGTSKSKFKIYIIDEVHMLSTPAFNALLKTLEEPPPHVKFIFATTEPHEIPITILSRCQRFDFKRISVELIEKKLKTIAEEENIKIDADSLFLIAKFSQGSLRDAESILEQLSTFTNGNIDIEKTKELLGLVDEEVFFELTELLIEKNITKIWQLINDLNHRGKDIPKLLKDFMHFLRDMLLIKEGIESSDLIDIRPNYRGKLKELSQSFNEEQILSLIDSLSSISYKLKRSESLIMDLEIYMLGLVKQLNSQNPTATVLKSVQPTSVTQKKLEEPKEEKKALTAQISINNQTAEIAPQKILNEKTNKEKEINFENLKTIWTEILKDIKNKSSTLSTLLTNSKIMGAENNIVKIELPITNNYFKTTLEKSKKFIQNKISEKIGRQIQIEFTHQIKQENGKEGIIEKTIKIFDAKIVKPSQEE
ncbi:MAG: DNA polymerase III subunit gamma/tau [Candidatus Omnitrophica bacterium]|nr:DNA polymerase III subunit gamma/tau [Candidatus Omnitrophota bacterium]MBU1048335.1 DNA polymerase III subunit gamma/tau [Candidatus Omnitrophota bacterium]MBU1630904.1 DNA polymerase III subunit gamma/tau [Candidatus Omnitrophota bacterium]MBU1889683.1 DNA polymerase III subunit gamma/tau [Candidatus Omnitrophota bacterium]